VYVKGRLVWMLGFLLCDGFDGCLVVFVVFFDWRMFWFFFCGW